VKLTRQYLYLTSSVAVLCWAVVVLFFLSLFVFGPVTGSAIPLIASFALLMLAGLVYTLLAFGARCPECADYVFVEKPGEKHPAARKRRYLNHWATVVIDILSRREFTCMYCGTLTPLAEL